MIELYSKITLCAHHFSFIYIFCTFYFYTLCIPKTQKLLIRKNIRRIKNTAVIELWWQVNTMTFIFTQLGCRGCLKESTIMTLFWKAHLEKLALMQSLFIPLISSELLLIVHLILRSNFLYCNQVDLIPSHWVTQLICCSKLALVWSLFAYQVSPALLDSTAVPPLYQLFICGTFDYPYFMINTFFLWDLWSLCYERLSLP